MATVPSSRGPQVRTHPLQYAPQQGARSDAAFGGVQGRQLDALGQGAQQFAVAMERVAVEKAQTEAFEADARIATDWIQWDSEARTRFRGQNIEGYAAEAKAWWDKSASEHSGQLSDRAKVMLNRTLAQKRVQAMQSVGAFTVGERERHADQVYAADIQASIEFGLRTGTVDSAASEVRNRVAGYAARKGWTPEMMQAEATKALTQLHGLHIQRLLDTDPDGAKAHLLAVSGDIDARSRIGFQQVVEKAGVLSKAQRLADSVVQRGLSLDQGLKEAESLDGEAERIAKIELRQRFADTEASRRDDMERTYGSALLQVEQSGRVKPATFALLDDKHKAAVLNRIQAEAKAREAAARDRPIKTDWNTYATLREQADSSPTEFAKTDLRQYLDKIGPTQFEQLLDVQSRLRKPDSKKGRSEQTLTSQVSDFASGLDMSTAKRAQFRSYVHDEIRAQEKALGRDLKDEEVTSIMDSALLKPPGFFQDRTFETEFQNRKRNATRGTTAPPAPVRVSTPEEARALPRGTRFQAPDGRILIAP